MLELSISADKPICISCDNKGAILLAKTVNVREKTKHIKVKHSFIKEKIEEGVARVIFTPSTQIVADSLTKAASEPSLDLLIKNMGLTNNSV